MSSVIGTVQWICKSSIRPGHKRKNWFVDVNVIPATGIAIESTEERSQYANKQRAIAKLQAVLQIMDREAVRKQSNQVWQAHNQIIRGNPVRTYVGGDFKREK